MADPRTGKEYMVLEMSASTLNHDTNQEKCRKIEGHLPEPRDEQDNLFLDSLGAERFVLGINDKKVEGQWVFDSDGSPLTWFSWATYSPWPRTGNGHCVSVLCHESKQNAGHRTQDWTNFPCNSNAYIQARPKSLICQKNKGNLIDVN